MLDTVPEATPTAMGSRPRRAELLLGGGLTLAYLLVLLLDLSVPQPTDHSHYMDAARDFPSRPHDPIFDHQYLRIGLTAPTALVMKVFGYSEVSYHTFPIATALLLFASVYAIGRMMFGRLVGALSAVVLGCVGIVLVGGTELLPDLPGTALFTAAVALAIALRQGLLGHRRLWLVVIGGLMGWSYLTREFIVFVWPLVPVLLWRRIGRRESLWWLGPLVLTFAGETALNSRLYGDPLARLHASSGLGNLPARPAIAATFHDLPLRVYLWRLPEGIGRQAAGPGLLLLLALTLAAGLAAAVQVVRHRRVRAGGDPLVRRAGVFALWVLLLWVPLTLLGGVLNPAHPKLRLQILRYWYPVFPAFVLGGIAAVWLLARALPLPARGRSIATTAGVSCVAVVVAAIGVFGRPGVPGWAGSPRVSSDALPEFRSWLGHSGARIVWADAKLFRVLPIYVKNPAGRRIWHGHVRPLHDTGQPAAGDYVVAYSIGSDACPLCGKTARATIPWVPSNWRPVMTSRDHLLRVWRVT